MSLSFPKFHLRDLYYHVHDFGGCERPEVDKMQVTSKMYIGKVSSNSQVFSEEFVEGTEGCNFHN